MKKNIMINLLNIAQRFFKKHFISNQICFRNKVLQRKNQVLRKLIKVKLFLSTASYRNQLSLQNLRNNILILVKIIYNLKIPRL